MRTGIIVASFVLAVAGFAAFMVALANMQTGIGETYSDIGNAAMITACFVSLSAMHLRRKAPDVD